jgi:Arc/MetJ family transcription regulator
MPTNLFIDDTLLNQAMKLGGLATKRATVNEALKEYIHRRARVATRNKRMAVLKALGTIDFDPSCDYKAARRKR